MDNWQALINVDGDPTNAKLRDNEMFLIEKRKIAFIWRHHNDKRIWVRIFDRELSTSSRPTNGNHRITEFVYENWEDGARNACAMLGVSYTPLPEYALALTDARIQLTRQKEEQREADRMKALRKNAPVPTPEQN